MHILINSELISQNNANISVSERGFRYGDGVFETISVHNDKPYQLHFHLERLRAGLAAIHITYDVDPLEADATRLIAANNLKDGFLRIYISRGQGGMGYMPDLHAVPLCVIETLSYEFTFQPAAHLAISSYEKISPKALPVQFKLAQGLQSTLGFIEAKTAGYQDAIILDANGHICETSSANIFWLKDNILYTPSLECGVLNGSTRHAVIKLSPYPAQEGQYPLSILKEAQAIFLTNARIKCQPVEHIESLASHWQSNELANYFYQLIINDAKNSG